MRIWTHNSLRWVYTSWFLFLNLCWTGRCWGIAFSIFSFRFWLKDTLGGVFFFSLKTSKTNYSWAQKSSSPTKRCLNWGSAADNVRSGTTVSQNGVSGFHYLQEWRGGESSGAAPACAPTQPRSEPECQEPGNVALLRASFPAAEKLRNGKEQGNSGFSAAPGWLDSLSCPCAPGPAPAIAVFPELLFISCPVPGYLSPHLHCHQDENVLSFFAVLLLCFLMLCSTWNPEPLGSGEGSRPVPLCIV